MSSFVSPKRWNTHLLVDFFTNFSIHSILEEVIGLQNKFFFCKKVIFQIKGTILWMSNTTSESISFIHKGNILVRSYWFKRFCKEDNGSRCTSTPCSWNVFLNKAFHTFSSHLVPFNVSHFLANHTKWKSPRWFVECRTLELLYLSYLLEFAMKDQTTRRKYLKSSRIFHRINSQFIDTTKSSNESWPHEWYTFVSLWMSQFHSKVSTLDGPSCVGSIA